MSLRSRPIGPTSVVTGIKRKVFHIPGFVNASRTASPVRKDARAEGAPPPLTPEVAEAQNGTQNPSNLSISDEPMPPPEGAVIHVSASLPGSEGAAPPPELPPPVPPLSGSETASDVSESAHVAPGNEMDDTIPVAVAWCASNPPEHKKDDFVPQISCCTKEPVQALRVQECLQTEHKFDVDPVREACVPSSLYQHESASESDEEEEHEADQDVSESESSVHTSHGASSSVKIPTLPVAFHPIAPILRHEPLNKPYALLPPPPPPPDDTLDGMTVQHASEIATADTAAPTHHHLLFMGIGVLSAFLLGLLAAPYI